MKQRPFLALWTIAVLATVTAFVVHLTLRGRTVELGYRLGRAHAEQARLREVKRVLSLEAASYETPQRVEMVARTLLGMTPPPPERVLALRGPVPMAPPEDQGGSDPVAVPVPVDGGAPGASPAVSAPAPSPAVAASSNATPGVILPRRAP